jgi:hypothetical protein
MRYRCSCGNESVINWNNFKSGRRCRKCGVKKQSDQSRLSFDYVRQYFNEHGCELLEKEYTTCNKPLRYRCVCGHESVINFTNFKQGARCSECRKKRLSEKFRLSFDYVKKFFNDNGCELLEKEYINARKKMKYRCIGTQIIFSQLKHF